jgi:DNA helicase-2/ATP-dependent DNA helicase PcrA
MAILVRTRSAYSAILKSLKTLHIPVTPGDRESLFEMEDAAFLGRVFAWFVDNDWPTSKHGSESEVVTLDSLKSLASGSYPGLDWASAERFLIKTKSSVSSIDSRRVSLVDVGYELLGHLGVRDWNIDDNEIAARTGTIAKFMKFVADYEGMSKHSRTSTEEANRQIGSADQGTFYWLNFATLMRYFAMDSYRDFGGEDGVSSDAVELMTVHASKGLEWPIVFIPSLTAKRFPSSKRPDANKWIVSTNLFDVQRYEGTDADERRLFYVAATRAREWLSLSAHEKVKTQRTQPSPYIAEALEIYEGTLDFPAPWVSKTSSEDDDVLQITFSEIADYISCGLSYRLRNRIGFPPAIVEEIGYGRAVHHLLRALAEEATRTGKTLTPRDVERLMATDFFLPFAGKAVSDRFRESARKLIFNYLNDHGDDMKRIWQTERPFELALPGALVSGRADVILDRHDGLVDNLAIVDYKTSVGEQDFGLQLQVYTEAGIREGLDVRGAFIHDLKDGTRVAVDTAEGARARAVETVLEAVAGIRERKFDAKPHVMKCGHCDVRAICRVAAKN